MRTLCYSVRLSGLTSISPLTYKAKGFDGSEAIIPKSQVFGQDYEVTKSEAYWISAWILEKKSIQYSNINGAVLATPMMLELVNTWSKGYYCVTGKAV